MSQVVNQNESAEMMTLIPEMTCEMANQSLMLRQQMACILAFLLIVHAHTNKHVSHGNITTRLPVNQ